MATACGGTPPGATRTPSGRSATALAPGSPSPTASQATACPALGSGLIPGTIAANFATALAFAPDGRLFYAERSGRIYVWQDGAPKLFASVATVTTEAGGGYSERGLLGLAISPTFATDHFVYGFFSDRNRTQQHLIRWTDCAGTSMDPVTLVTVPAGADCCHKGGRIAFAPDGMLYLTLGDEHTAGAAQNLADPRGKVLRFKPDGSIPGDNPFGATNPVWAYGLRNPFGIAISASGQIAVTSNGPSGDAGSPASGYDLLFTHISRGAGYTWPTCYGYGHPISSGGSCPAGQFGPDWSSEARTVVPTGVAFIDALASPTYAGHIVFCTYNAGMLIVTPGTPHASVSAGANTCRLAVTEAPDHTIYASDPTHIYQLS